MFENIQLFLKRTNSSDQSKSNVFFLKVLHSSRWNVTLCQPKIQHIPFFLSYLQKAENSLVFTFCWLLEKNKNSLWTKISADFSLYSVILHRCAQVNMYNCTVFGRKRFHCNFTFTRIDIVVTSNNCWNNYDETMSLIRITSAAQVCAAI